MTIEALSQPLNESLHYGRRLEFAYAQSLPPEHGE